MVSNRNHPSSRIQAKRKRSNGREILVLGILLSICTCAQVAAWDIRYDSDRSRDQINVYISTVSSDQSTCSERPPVMLFACNDRKKSSVYFGNGCPPSYPNGANSFTGTVHIDHETSNPVDFFRHQNSLVIFGDNSLNSSIDGVSNIGAMLSQILESESLEIHYLSSAGELEKLSFQTAGLRDLEPEAKSLCGW